MKYSRSLLVLVVILPACWQTQPPLDYIVESNTIAAVFNYLHPQDYTKNTLVILDIDNTVLRPSTHLGSDEWFYAMVGKKEQQGMNHQDAIDHVLPTLIYLQDTITVVPVEPDTVPIINKIQNNNITVIALTARSLDLAHRTVQQIHSLGIDLSSNLPHECPIQYGDGKPALYIDGIIFVGNHDKGEVLAHWLSQINYTPTKVIFIDDKLKNVTSVEKAMRAKHIPFIGIRYSHLDEYIQNINLDTIDKEYKTLLKRNKNHPTLLHSISGGAFL